MGQQSRILFSRIAQRCTASRLLCGTCLVGSGTADMTKRVLTVPAIIGSALLGDLHEELALRKSPSEQMRLGTSIARAQRVSY